MAPWSSFWERNFFARSVPALHGVLDNLFVRGGVSGIGGITLLAGLAEIGGHFMHRPGRTGTPEPLEPLNRLDRPEPGQ